MNIDLAPPASPMLDLHNQRDAIQNQAVSEVVDLVEKHSHALIEARQEDSRLEQEMEQKTADLEEARKRIREAIVPYDVPSCLSDSSRSEEDRLQLITMEQNFLKSLPVLIEERRRRRDEAARLDFQILESNMRVGQIELEYQARLATIMQTFDSIHVYTRDRPEDKPVYRLVQSTPDIHTLINRVEAIYGVSKKSPRSIFLMHHRNDHSYIVGSDREFVAAVDWSIGRENRNLEFEVFFNYQPEKKRDYSEAESEAAESDEEAEHKSSGTMHPEECEWAYLY